MLDFVHLNWVSYSHWKPEENNVYLFLVKDKGEVLIKPLIYFDGEIVGTADKIIAWADQKNITFDRDPEKPHTCNSKKCTFANDCSTCTLTTKLEDAKWADWFL